MSVDATDVRDCMDSLRHDGLISRQFDNGEVADEWRAAMRRACRAEHLRINTFLWPGRGDGMTPVTAYVQHRDHVVTDAERRAMAELMGDLVVGRTSVPFSERVRAIRRETMHVVVAGDNQEVPDT